MYHKQLSDMTADEIAAIQDEERQEQARQAAYAAEREKLYAAREASIAEARERDRAARAIGHRPTRTDAAERQALALRSLLGDNFAAFAAIFAGHDAMAVQRWVARMAPPVRSDTAAGGRIAQLCDAANRAAADFVARREAESLARRQAELDARAL